jgi:hypothetical protein
VRGSLNYLTSHNFIKSTGVGGKRKKQSQSKYKKMAQENLHELSTEDLIKKKKTLSFATGILIGALTVLLIITILRAINKESCCDI